MTTNSMPVLLLEMVVMTGCGAPPGTADEPAAIALSTAADIKDIPAVDRQHYPDSIGYLYQGSLATVFWIQNVPETLQIDDLTRRMGSFMERGLAGEIVAHTMQAMDPVPDNEPTLPELARRTVQSLTTLAQYSFVMSDYAGQLGTALSAYNTNPARVQALKDKSALVEAELHAMVMANPPGGPSRPVPAPNQRLLRPGKFFSDTVRDHSRALLARSIGKLQRAISAANPAAYASAFVDVFFMQRDIELSKLALEGLAAHHTNGLLQGQPLDKLVAFYTSRSPDQTHPYAVDQLCLINQINLLSNNAGASRRALIAALMLIDEDHRQQEQDPTISTTLIWQHVGDADWLVQQYVRLKGNGTTADEANTEIDNLVVNS